MEQWEGRTGRGADGTGESKFKFGTNIFAGVHDSMDSDCEVLGGRWPGSGGLYGVGSGPGGRASGWVICLQSWELQLCLLGSAWGAEVSTEALA